MYSEIMVVKIGCLIEEVGVLDLIDIGVYIFEKLDSVILGMSILVIEYDGVGLLENWLYDFFDGVGV